MSRPLHLVYLCGEYPPASHGGIGTFTRVMAHAMAARGHTVSVLGVQPGLAADVREDDGPVRVWRLAPHGRGVGALRNARALTGVLAALHAERPVQVVEGAEGAFALLSVPRGVARVVRLHGGHHFFAALEGRPRRPVTAWLERRSLARATHVCAVSRYVAAETVRHLPWLGARPVEVLHNPVDPHAFAPPAVAPEFPDRVLFVGTLCEKKGVRDLLQAFAAVAEAVPAAELELVGRDGVEAATGGSYRQAMRTLLPAPLAARVHFAGALPHHEVAARLAQAAVCVFPSRAEALGIAALEAMAMGKACVATSHGPFPELIEPDRSGLLVPPAAPAALADALVQLLRDAPLRRRLGEGARARVLAHFALADLVPRNAAFYERCAAGMPEPRQ